MAKVPSRHGKEWSNTEISRLPPNWQTETSPTRLIALKLKRTPGAVYSKASDEGIGLKPTNQEALQQTKVTRRATGRCFEFCRHSLEPVATIRVGEY